ncbi:DUF916 and DUF3324 domain-containing protein [Listeria sp. PSOL-1]|uniref:DUF916 and DUF3324 domain-containing protein n=1 Tax=Listeria sp. PSOL-1 TaxID=1844999 RepID=UPI0013D0B1E7|nr:DUF916 and DUF3324 domain-containing protein [Listeria sp. PSOL-1]
MALLVKQKYLKSSISFLLFLLLLLLFPLTSHAVDLSYEVKPHLDPQSGKKGLDYFYSEVKPNETKTFSFDIINHSNSEARFKVQLNRAVTNKNGFIDYSIQSKKKVPHDFNQMVNEREQEVTVPAQGKKEVTFTVKLPKQKFQGIVLGGVYVTEINTASAKDASNSKSGIGFNQQLAYAMAVVLQEEVPYKGGSKVQLYKIQPTPNEAQATLKLDMENIRPNILNNVSLKMKIYRSGEKSVYKTLQKQQMRFAPSDRFKLFIPWSAAEMKPGDYEVDIEVTSGQEKWLFKKKFSISKDDNALLKAEGTPFAEEKSPSMIIYWLLGLLAITVIILVIIILRRKRK